jgi:hypothetical protein
MSRLVEWYKEKNKFWKAAIWFGAGIFVLLFIATLIRSF